MQNYIELPFHQQIAQLVHDLDLVHCGQDLTTVTAIDGKRLYLKDASVSIEINELSLYDDGVVIVTYSHLGKAKSVRYSVLDFGLDKQKQGLWLVISD